MIIPSALIKLNYDLTTDVLAVEWPDVHSYTLPEVHETLDEVLKTIRYYDVKRLLIDSSQTIVSIQKEQYAAIASGFAKQLQATRLEKVARLESIDTMREAHVKAMGKSSPIPTIAFNNFTDRAEALKWLEAGS